jgi:hypothetical protein
MTHQQSSSTPEYTANPAPALAGMAKRLRRHSALEDLGPLFGPKAQGRQPDSQPTVQPAPSASEP